MTELPGTLTLGDLLDAKLVLDVLLASSEGGTDTRHYLEGAVDVVGDCIKRAQA